MKWNISDLQWGKKWECKPLFLQQQKNWFSPPPQKKKRKKRHKQRPMWFPKKLPRFVMMKIGYLYIGIGMGVLVVTYPGRLLLRLAECWWLLVRGCPYNLLPGGCPYNLQEWNSHNLEAACGGVWCWSSLCGLVREWLLSPPPHIISHHSFYTNPVFTFAHLLPWDTLRNICGANATRYQVPGTRYHVQDCTTPRVEWIKETAPLERLRSWTSGQSSCWARRINSWSYPSFHLTFQLHKIYAGYLDVTFSISVVVSYVVSGVLERSEQWS